MSDGSLSHIPTRTPSVKQHGCGHFGHQAIIKSIDIAMKSFSPVNKTIDSSFYYSVFNK
ncbi:hypothetical protein GTU79_11475 [Sodalis ligni]|uniref:hypothetical protein n=1 Tax=Sodalis ligni TaxID=2697027 RepID=UPI001BDE4666|nr:hypothetical protein [Sodalis ligni]QWA13209.1 hypothetical protein GTU79_11475 [Sodalis ligni]